MMSLNWLSDLRNPHVMQRLGQNGKTNSQNPMVSKTANKRFRDPSALVAVSFPPAQHEPSCGLDVVLSGERRISKLNCE
jgi:hypothetical protein